MRSRRCRQEKEIRALDATVRACRRVWCEYQGQLLWKGVSDSGGGGDAAAVVEDGEDFLAVFEAEASRAVFATLFSV